ncbi:NHLP family bacteriocin export ABC transporter peptidase/permease/ATPase subunit [Aquimonas sp.]|jgi:NHLM bacteriocin system ABC transporter peptidase/ATP-binding protein|uniref:NHLP family bacteriocin export ABC transporter peptidase/permease/ATPase subunit n=1 Tax=Aquimonas sp. TaxID=1872588 RepID=UPI0037BF3C1F
MAAAAPAADKAAKPAKQPKSRRYTTPTRLQMEAVECGAAALAIVLSYYGRHVTLEELRQECGVSRDGSKASNVLKAARKYGLEAKGYKQELEALYDIELPAILFWNFNHFLVLEGFRNGRAFLNDPASGPRTCSMEELDGSFSGVVLTLKPGPDFKKGGTSPDLKRQLLERLRGAQVPLLFAVLCGLALVIPGLVVPTFGRLFIDEYLIGGRADLLQPLLWAMAITAAVMAMLTWLQESVLLRLETSLALRTSADFFNHILRLPVSYFAQRFAGEIGSRVALNDKVSSLISGRLVTLVIDSVLIVFYAVLMLFYSVPLTLLCIGLAGINLAAVKQVARARVDASRRLAQESGKLVGTAMGGLRMIETIKATGSEPEFFTRWAGYQAKALKSEQALGSLSATMSSVPPLVSALISVSILVYGGLLVMDGALTVGMLVAYQALMFSFVRPLNNLVAFGGALQELEADMNRIDDVLANPQDAFYDAARTTSPAAKGLIKLSGEIELRKLCFGYSPLEKPLIEDFDLHIKPGQRVALVGGSGSGKSTVAKLIAGLYTPWSGEILFQGIDRQALPHRLISNSLGVIDQEVFLFRGTVRDNLTVWDETVPDALVTAAARDAAIAEVIETRDGAYASEVEEGGGNFSGGQAQRLEIARALVGSPTMLILDEATSALDPITEMEIDEAIRRRGCTCVIVAHRLTSIRDCDEIIVMERGRIVQRGTHDQLKEQRGLYAELIKD